jgi:hypothetical protein
MRFGCTAAACLAIMLSAARAAESAIPSGELPVIDLSGFHESAHGAVRWLAKVKLTGVRVERAPAPKEEFLRHTADWDAVVVSDPSAPPLWARHYEIGTNRPVFAGRDGVRKYALADIERERRTGTPWYGKWPLELIQKDYPAWRARIANKSLPAQ